LIHTVTDVCDVSDRATVPRRFW